MERGGERRVARPRYLAEKDWKIYRFQWDRKDQTRERERERMLILRMKKLR